MAGRFLLIEFDDEATATHLREQIDVASRKGKGFRVVGLFARPGNFCKCPSRVWITERGKAAKVKRGAKFGWSVCTDCKRPLPVMSFLKNLIAPEDIIRPPRYDIVSNDSAKAIPVGFYTHGLSAPALAERRFTDPQDQ
jgi:hypothetical protein